MKKQKNHLFLGYIAIIYGMILLFSLISNFAGRENEHWRFFYAFTQQSNIIVMIWLFLFGADAFKQTKLHKAIHSKIVITSITVYISITFFIVAFVLDPIYTGKWDPLSSTGEFLHHNLTPVVMWIYFFLVQGYGKIKLRSALFILIYPFTYMCANLLIGANINYLNSEPAYAYGFINPSNYPNLIVFILVIIGLIAVFALFGVMLIKLKQFLEKIEN